MSSRGVHVRLWHHCLTRSLWTGACQSVLAQTSSPVVVPPASSAASAVSMAMGVTCVQAPCEFTLACHRCHCRPFAYAQDSGTLEMGQTLESLPSAVCLLVLALVSGTNTLEHCSAQCHFAQDIFPDTFPGASCLAY